KLPFAGEDELGGAGHPDLALAVPLDLEGAAGELDRGAGADVAVEASRDHDAAGAGAASQGQAGAALPDAHAQAIGRQHVHDLEVRARGEVGVTLDEGADALERELPYRGLDEGHRVGIAHGDAGYVKFPPLDREVALDGAAAVERALHGDFLGLEARRAHADADADDLTTLAEDLELLEPGKGPD